MAFLGALNNHDSDGRIIANQRDGSLRFVLLNAAAHFAQVIPL